jgi:hypothetical protein
VRCLCLVIVFHFNDGKRTFTDSTGIELTGIVAARHHACAQIRDMLSAKTGRPLQDWTDWKTIISDANGKTIYEVGFDLIPRSSN